MNDNKQLNRWRLILGSQAKDQISFGTGGTGGMENGVSYEELEEALDFLYSREYGEDDVASIMVPPSGMSPE